MRVRLDREKCEGYGTCVTVAPDVFDFDPDADKAVVLTPVVDDSRADDFDEAIRSCPVHALSRG